VRVLNVSLQVRRIPEKCLTTNLADVFHFLDKSLFFVVSKVARSVVTVFLAQVVLQSHPPIHCDFGGTQQALVNTLVDPTVKSFHFFLAILIFLIGWKMFGTIFTNLWCVVVFVLQMSL